MNINQASVLHDVGVQFARYEEALVNNDLVVLDELFWDSTETLRFGAGENLYGIDEIRAFRSRRAPTGLNRTVVRTHITTFGDDFATTHIEFQRPGMDKVGRQTQAWARLPEGWRIVSAHVSLMI